MTPEQIEVYHGKLLEMSKDHECPMCGHGTRTDVDRGQFYLSLIAVCDNCPACTSYHVYLT